MDDLEKIDDSTYQSPQDGEIYTALEHTGWCLTDQDRKASIVSQLEETLESLALTRSDANRQAPVLNTDEYFGRIETFWPTRIIEAGSYTDFCNTIAAECIKKGFYKLSLGVFLTDIDKIKASYAEQLNSAVEELIEYRRLQQVRSELDKEDLTKYLQQIFIKKVSVLAGAKFRSTVEDLEAELSLCLTGAEKEEQLKTEYKNRLEIYKTKANTSILAHAGLNFELIPWQCFTAEHLDQACSDLVYAYVNWKPNDIDFDLSLINQWSKNKINEETSQLASEWRVIEWIKAKLAPNVITIPAPVNRLGKGNDQPNEEQESNGAFPTLYIAPEVRKALYDAIEPYVDEPQRTALSNLLAGTMPGTRITLNCQQNEFAAAFHSSIAVPRGKAKLFSGLLPKYFVRNDGRGLVELSPSTLEKHLRGIDLPKQ